MPRVKAVVKAPAKPAKPSRRLARPRPSAEDKEIAALLDEIQRKLDDLHAKSRDLLRDLDHPRAT